MLIEIVPTFGNNSIKESELWWCVHWIQNGILLDSNSIEAIEVLLSVLFCDMLYVQGLYWEHGVFNSFLIVVS